MKGTDTMSGFLETLKATVDAQGQQIAALVAAVQALQTAGTVIAAAPVAAQPAPVAPVAANPLGGMTLGTPAPVAAASYPAATGEQIVALISPYVENQQIKDALGAEMRAMGIDALPNTQAHQYGELMHRFQQVIARFQQSATAAAPVAAAPLSLV